MSLQRSGSFMFLILVELKIIYIVCSAPKATTDPVHLVLKNVNFYTPKRQSSNKDFDILDFSIYLPKATTTTIFGNSSKDSSPTITSTSSLSYAGRISTSSSDTSLSLGDYKNSTPLKKPKVTKEKNHATTAYSTYQPAIPKPDISPHFDDFPKVKSQRPHFEALTGVPNFHYTQNHHQHNKPHFEALISHPPQKAKVRYTSTPRYEDNFYRTASSTLSPPTIPTTWRPKFHQQLNFPQNQYTINLPNVKYRPTQPPQSYFLPTPAPTQAYNPYNKNVNTQIYYDGNSGSNLKNFPSAPRFEALTAQKPNYIRSNLNTQIHYDGGGTTVRHFPSTPHFEALTAPRPNYLYDHVTYPTLPPRKQPNTPHYEALVAHNNYNGNNNKWLPMNGYNLQNYHHQPTPQPLYTNYNGQNYKSLKKGVLLDNVVYHNDAEGSYSDNSYGVKEVAEESRKNYKKLPTNATIPFQIKINEDEDNDDEDDEIKNSFDKPSVSSSSLNDDDFEFVEDKPKSIDYHLGNFGQKDEIPNKGNYVKEIVKITTAKPKRDEIKYFQDIFISQKSPFELEFGHILDSPQLSEERYERNDRKNHKYQGKVKWTDKNGGYGEHYWYLGHIQPNSS